VAAQRNVLRIAHFKCGCLSPSCGWWMIGAAIRPTSLLVPKQLGEWSNWRPNKRRSQIAMAERRTRTKSRWSMWSSSTRTAAGPGCAFENRLSTIGDLVACGAPKKDRPLFASPCDPMTRGGEPIARHLPGPPGGSDILVQAFLPVSGRFIIPNVAGHPSE
jgi:hypothetical protein